MFIFLHIMGNALMEVFSCNYYLIVDPFKALGDRIPILQKENPPRFHITGNQGSFSSRVKPRKTGDQQRVGKPGRK